MDDNIFITLNLPPSIQPPSQSQISDIFTLTAAPSTALWRQPLSSSTVTAPMLLTKLQHPFIVAEVTVSADFDMEWDQGGLVIFSGPIADASPCSSPSTSSSSQRQRRRSCFGSNSVSDCETGKWVKAGLELSGGMLNASSVVATKESGADWSLCPICLPTSTHPHHDYQMSLTSLRIKFERIGDSLWIWYRVPNTTPSSYTFLSYPSPEGASQEWRKLREVMGFFGSVEQKENVWVGCYASRPTAAVRDEGFGALEPEGLAIDFEDLEIL